MKITNKVAIVTGSSSGIGKAIVLLLAQKGARVVVNSRNNAKGGEDVVSMIVGGGGEAFHVQSDVSTTEGAEKVIKAAVKKYGKVDILVNNAGTSSSNDLSDYEAWEKLLTNIFLSCVMTTAEFLKIISSDLRKIINISSIYSLLNNGNTDFMAYSAAKAAMNSFTVTLAKKLSGSVQVNAIAPGYTLTPSWGENPKKFEKDMKKETHIGRFITADEIATTVLHLIENDAITGQILTVDGGATLKEMF